MSAGGRRAAALAAAVGLSCGFSLLPLPALGAEEPPAPAAPAKPEVEKPEVIPVAEVGNRATAVDARLRQIEADLSAAKLEKSVEQSLPETKAEIDAREKTLKAELSERYTQSELRELDAGWLDLDQQLSARAEEIDDRASQLDAWIDEIGKSTELWQRTRTATRSAGAPRAVASRVGATLEALAETQRKLEKTRNAALDLQSRILEQRRSVQAALEMLETAKAELLASLFVRQGEPLWRVRFAPEEVRQRLARSSANAMAELSGYVERHRDRLILHGLIIVALLWIVPRARSALEERAGRHSAPGSEDESAGSSPNALSHPRAAALLLGLTLSIALHPQAPRLFWILIALFVLAAWGVVLGGLLPAGLRAPLYGLGALVLMEWTRRFLDDLPFLSQLVLTVELVVGLVGILWLRRPERLRRIPPLLGGSVWLRVLDGWLRLALVTLGASLVAEVFGYLNLADLLTRTIVSGTFVGTLLLASVRIAEAVVQGVVETGALDRVYMIRRRPEVAVAAAQRGLRALGLFTWVYVVLRNASLWEPAWSAGADALSAQLGYGPMTFSVGDLLAFGLTLWISWLLARLVSFVLDQEVLARVRMPQGVPFALTTFTRYAILVVGFLAAIGMLGFSLDRVTLLLSALGVGIGFGLQNVINNFVSGVILLFERPIRVGDRVQLDDLLGMVTDIGIRASNVRTFDGSDVLVPNGDFISSRVINWTLSDRQRRIILPVGVAYGTKPKQVLEILERVARSLPEVLADPAPEVLFLGFGESSLDFQIRVWTESQRGWLPVQSDLAVATSEALAEAGIEIPFPQRDLHVRNLSALRQTLAEGIRDARQREQDETP